MFNVTEYMEAGKAPGEGLWRASLRRDFRVRSGEGVAVTQPCAAGRQAGRGTAGEDCSGRGHGGRANEKSLCARNTARWDKDQQQRHCGVRPGKDGTLPWQE